ncbi:FAD-dependent monooxygenase [Sphingobacterium faecale]|uniref:FAD-dependent monooxygenase n=1 Tax=Sphingobacterium faecale TaxID=2803775 RepID=A0ABS1R607_9SPHI|nr:FAD-dependent monooxygenase [Sphingobacterium faecale]MBL1409950.1 FAD-dependent monooxygenase [Sphingobacterium faecale]
MKIAIIGGGIAGLTTAIVLRNQGIEPTIYESADNIKHLGAGILLANNAMQVFKKLGIHKEIEDAGMKISNVKITDSQLITLSETNLDRFEDKYGVYNVAIHRADLLNILTSQVGFQNIHLSKRLNKIEKKDGFKLIFEDETTVNAEAIIGADGIKSVVRNQLFDSGNIRDTGQRCWRGVVELDWDLKYRHEAFESWGKGKRFGFAKITDKKVYWYAVVNQSLLDKEPDITSLFREFHPDIIHIISKTAISDIIFNDIIDLSPFKQWTKGNACLIGDAAHATTPNMGQGACQAIEDAYAIGKLLERSKTITETFLQYEALRINKAHTIVNTSWKLGNMAHMENDLGIWFRNKLIKLMPESIRMKQMDKMFDISYIDNFSKKSISNRNILKNGF